MAYPQQERMQRMLRLLYDALDGAQERGKVQLMVEFYTHNGGVLEISETRQNLGDELGLSAAQAAALLRQLDRDGYIHLDYSSQGPRADFGLVTLDHFTEKGKVAIGELPEPHERLVESLDALAAALEREDLTPKQREQGRRVVQELGNFLRGLPPSAAVEAGSTFIRSLFGG